MFVIFSHFLIWVKAGRDGSRIPTLWYYYCPNTTNFLGTVRSVTNDVVAASMQITVNKVGMEGGKGQDCPLIWASGEQPFGRREVNDLACGLVSLKLCAGTLGVAGSCILNPCIIGAVWIIEGLRSKRMNFRVGRQYWKLPSWEDLLKQQKNPKIIPLRETLGKFDLILKASVEESLTKIK